MDNDKIGEIKDLLKDILRKRFKNSTPGLGRMQIDTWQLDKSKKALHYFMYALSNNFGSVIFEPIACHLAKNRYIVRRRASVGNIITQKAQRVIQDIMDNLEYANTTPNKQEEVKAIMEVAHVGDISHIKPTKVDLFLQNNKEVYLIDITTAKAVKSNFREIKRNLLTWTAVYAYENPDIKFHTLMCVPFNPYAPKPYHNENMVTMIDIKRELKVAREFWDFIGGKNTYSMLLRAFKEVGQEMEDEINRFNYEHSWYWWYEDYL